MTSGHRFFLVECPAVPVAAVTAKCAARGEAGGPCMGSGTKLRKLSSVTGVEYGVPELDGSKPLLRRGMALRLSKDRALIPDPSRVRQGNGGGNEPELVPCKYY